MKGEVKKGIILVGVVLVIVIFCIVRKQMSAVENYQDKYQGTDLTVEVDGLGREGTYTEYQNSHETVYPSEDIPIDVCDYEEGTDVTVYQDFDGAKEALYTGDNSKVTWKVDVKEAGLYQVYLEYQTVESRGVAAERALYINGELPFADASNLTFSRLWTDGGEVRTDNQGNQIRPTQVEVYDWQGSYCQDDMGYTVKPYEFYFEKGENELTLEAVNEPVILRAVTLCAVKEKWDYETYLANQKTVGETQEYVTKIQGEDSTLRSEPSLYAKYDRASANTEPYSVTNTILNYTGGDAWNAAGQWIEWEFEVPEDGFYNITVKGRQNYARGSVSSRCLYLDGEVPFQEVETISFEYDNDWNVMTLSDENGTPYEFYLAAGKHTLRLEATLGGMGEILEELEDSTYRLNQIYRRILVYTGANPDKYRDYNINQVYPEVMEAMDLEAKRLYKIIDDVVAYTGQKAEKIATAQTLAQQMELFLKRPDKITVNFTTFKDNITSLGTAILNMSETKLDVDYIEVNSVGSKVPEDKASAFAKIWHEIKSFAASFVVDYDAVGDVYSDKDEGIVKVWIVTGRDQGTILKTMVDDTFTPESGVKVNVEIVDPTALLNAVVAGRGPDVVLSVGADQPVNYALRNAVEDLRQFEDCDEVLSVFYDSAYRAYEYNDGLYAIPETQTYNVMFYRKDILEELGLTVPDTWDELVDMLPTIQGNNMEVGIPSTASTTLPDLSLFYTLLYQGGSDVYDDEAKKTIIDNEAGVNAFATYTSFFNDYGMPTEYDFVSRFRSGQMPIGIANYSIYNTLVVSAPEIRGLWDFTLIPATEVTDETGAVTKNRSVYSTGTCSMMIKTEDETVRQNAWTFMKWWAQTDTQVRFGRELEALLGSSARYATANREAFDQLAWSADDVEVLEEQWKSAVGFREVAGGYYTGRHIVNAVRKVINEKEDPRETILDYAITINDELIKKRTEFGLPTD